MLSKEDLSRIDWIVEKATLAQDKLTSWERSFLQDVFDRRGRLSARMTMSERQWEILEAIGGKAI